MKRRDFLRAAALGGTAWAQPADAVIELRPREAGPEIARHLYGHFIEHLGGVIYDGIWVGRGSPVPNLDGIRAQFVEDMKRIHAPNLRWPGGCFADGYHWRDGIGAVSRRHRTYNYWQARMPAGVDATETNHFGTHEFMRLCELIGAEPYLAANVASGTPREFYDWVMYCNAPLGTVTQAEERGANGHGDPFHIRYWGIGNESWGCGGFFKPQEYAAEYRRFVAQVPRYGELFLIAAGPSGGDLKWTRGFFESLPPGAFQGGRPPLDGFALHYYTHFRNTGSPAADFTPQQWYAVLDAGARVEQLIEEHWKAMGEFDSQHRVKLVVDEWGTWYRPGTELGPQYLLSQTVTLRDALHAALTLDIFNRHAEKLAMANLAQTINCLDSLFLAQGGRFTRTPVYWVYDLYRGHMGARRVPIAIRAAGARVSGSASLAGNHLTLTLVNTSLDAGVQAAVELSGAVVREARARVLTHAEMRAANTFDAPDRVRPQPLAVSLAAGRAGLKIPKQSVAAVELSLA